MGDLLCMGLFLRSRLIPSLWSLDGADHRLAARMNVDMLDRDFLLAFAAMAVERNPSPDMFEQTFRNIDDALWKEAGCTTELDYIEQTSWLLFLKYLDDLERDRADEAALAGRAYAWILEPQYRWDRWAAPRDKAGALDLHKARTGDDLRDFVTNKLFPYLDGFKERGSDRQHDYTGITRAREPPRAVNCLCH